MLSDQISTVVWHSSVSLACVGSGMLAKNPSDTDSVRSYDVGRHPFHVEVMQGHFHLVFVMKIVESHVSLFHKELKFVLLPAIGELLQKTGVGSIDWAQDLVVEGGAFGGQIMGCLVTGKDLRFFVSGKDCCKAFSQHSIDLGIGDLGEAFNGHEYTDGS